MEELMQGEVLATAGGIWAIMLALKKSKLLDRWKGRSLVYNLLPLLLGAVAGCAGFIEGSSWQNRLALGLVTSLVVGKMYDTYKSTEGALKS